MARKNRDPEPVFKGYDDQGEPMFAFSPETPTWLRVEWIKLWKEAHRAPGPERSKT